MDGSREGESHVADRSHALARRRPRACVCWTSARHPAFDAIHDQAAPRRVLKGIRDALRPDGTFLMVDIATSSHLERNMENPLAPFLFTVSTMHCTTVSLAQGGEGLGACWGEEQARELLAEAGFTSVEVASVEGDPMNAYYLCR
jgi:hypothetical protein